VWQVVAVQWHQVLMQVVNQEMVPVEQVVDYQLVLVQMVFLVDHLDIMQVVEVQD
jgi:hypothetical protein